MQSLKNEIKEVVYFIQNGRDGDIKIGYTKKLKTRFKTLQTASPVKLQLLGYILGNKLDEKKLHLKFAQYRINGEWFKVNDELIEYINENNIMNVYINVEDDGKLRVLTRLKK